MAPITQVGGDGSADEPSSALYNGGIGESSAATSTAPRGRIADHLINRIADLLPWNSRPSG